ncbi:flagellar filament capping protein FliD [Nocardioidaceae bacterium]|nr:flagellar filament capping protein FliD [Nocardioidaceae bacterium]
MANASIGGLASGLDTSSIISQLMQLEAIPQTRLQQRLDKTNSLLTTMRTVNSNLAGIGTKAEKLADPANWTPTKATSSVDTVSITASKDAQPGSYDLTVDQVARSHQLGYTAAAALTDVVLTGSTQIRLDRLDGTTVDVGTTDGTLQGVIDALNDPANDTGLRASAVKVADGSYRLLVESKDTGAASDFTLTNTDGSAVLGGATVRAGQDAQVTFGAGITATSATNTFADLLPGVTVTLGATTATGSAVRLDVSRDTAGLVKDVKALVDAMNTSLTEIDNLTKYNATTNASGKLAGESSVRAARTALASAVFSATGGSLSEIGIELTREGTLTFDDAKFTEAYNADPAGVAARFTGTDGFAGRVQTVAEGASDKTDGTVTAAIQGKESTTKLLKDDIARWDDRLELRRTTLTRTFTALETALSRLQAEGNWLAGQLGSLPSYSSGQG